MTTPTTGLPLKRGSRGEAAKAWQRFLNLELKLGRSKVSYPYLVEDGVFGAQSEAATAAWKKAHYPVGPPEVVGYSTWAYASIPPRPSVVTLPGRSLCAGSPLRRS